MTATTDTTARVAGSVGVGRCLGFALGALPLPDGYLTRTTLSALVPWHASVSNSSPRAHSVRGWLMKAERAGKLRRGRYLVQPTAQAALLAEALRYLGDDWCANDFVDIPQALQRYVDGHLGDTTGPLARRVTLEMTWLAGIDVSTLGRA